MARYNTTGPTTSVTGTNTILTPSQGTVVTITGSAGNTTTIPDPRQYPGVQQIYYNATAGTTYLSTPSGQFNGIGSSGTATQSFPVGSTLTLASDGTNYVIINEDGGPLTATTGAFSGTVSTTATTGFNITASSTDDSTSNATGAATFAGGVAINKNITIGKNGANTGKLRIEGSTSGTITFQAAATTTGGTYTFPAADATSSGYALTSNGSGTLSWTNASVAVATTNSNTIMYPMFANQTSGILNTAQITTTSSGLSFNPSTNNLVVGGVVNLLRPESGVQTTSYTLALTDKDQVVQFNNSTTVSVTVPTNASVPFPIGSLVWIARIGTGTVSLVAAGGVSLTKTGNLGLNEEFYLRKRGTDSWMVVASTTNGSGVFGSASSTGIVAGNSVGYYTSAGNGVGSFTAS